MKYYKKGTLNDLVEDERSEIIGYRFIYRMLINLYELEKRGILHRDIKPENIFIDDDNDFVLGDFGISKNIMENHNLTFGIGTSQYMHPKLLDTNITDYSNEIDFYSFLHTLKNSFPNVFDQWFLHEPSNVKDTILENNYPDIIKENPLTVCEYGEYRVFDYHYFIENPEKNLESLDLSSLGIVLMPNLDKYFITHPTIKLIQVKKDKRLKRTYFPESFSYGGYNLIKMEHHLNRIYGDGQITWNERLHLFLTLGMIEFNLIKIYDYKYIGVDKYPYVFFTVAKDKEEEFDPDSYSNHDIIKELEIDFLNSVKNLNLLENMDFNGFWKRFIPSIIDELVTEKIIDIKDPITKDLLDDFKVLYPKPRKFQFNFSTVLNHYKQTKNSIQDGLNGVDQEIVEYGQQNYMEINQLIKISLIIMFCFDLKFQDLGTETFIFKLNPNYQLTVDNDPKYFLVISFADIFEYILDNDELISNGHNLPYFITVLITKYRQIILEDDSILEYFIKEPKLQRLKPIPDPIFQDIPNDSKFKSITINGEKHLAKIYKLCSDFDYQENFVIYELMEEHPNIVKIISTQILDGYRYTIMKHYQDGDLHSLIENKRRRIFQQDNCEIWKLAFQIISAINHIDDYYYFHSDIKPSNILVKVVNQENNYILADLESLQIKDHPDAMKGTFEYQPPSLHGKPYDLYSLGITILKIIIDVNLQKIKEI
eukprot:gene3723-4637_t